MFAAVRVLGDLGFDASERWVKPLRDHPGFHELRPPAADGRILRVVLTVEDGAALTLHGGDKTDLGNDWYPPAIAAAEAALVDHRKER